MIRATVNCRRSVSCAFSHDNGTSVDIFNKIQSIVKLMKQRAIEEFIHRNDTIFSHVCCSQSAPFADGVIWRCIPLTLFFRVISFVCFSLSSKFSCCLDENLNSGLTLPEIPGKNLELRCLRPTKWKYLMIDKHFFSTAVNYIWRRLCFFWTEARFC